MSFKLRDYQQEAVDKTLSYFQKKRDPAVIVLPTGAGKSIVIAQLASLAKGRVLVLAHVKELVEQNSQKLQALGHEVGIYSAGLNKKQSNRKTIFGSVQSVARAADDFFNDFSLLIIDECHRVAEDDNGQYQQVIKKLRDANSHICILGLTATPYRLGLGWIYEVSHKGEIKSQEPRFFKRCLFELELSYMIRKRHLTRPIKVDIPVTCYDFSELSQKNHLYSQAEVERLITQQKRLTPLIIKNIIDITEQYQRQGVMLFAASVNHAKEALKILPPDQAKLITGETPQAERDAIIDEFKAKKFKYLVNVSVLTTGFDAPHVDVIAILRPTESVSLYQQIIGRGLRLSEGKEDCYILDYTGMGHDIYTPEVSDKKPSEDTVPVNIPCPSCGHDNLFWGIVDEMGNILEHFGRKCKGVTFDENYNQHACGFRFRFKLCSQCGCENDLTARECHSCQAVLIDADSKLKQARLSKDAVVIRPDHAQFEQRYDKNANPFLEIKYFDLDANSISEVHFLNNQTAIKKFHINFLRSHLKRPEMHSFFKGPEDVIRHQGHMRVPAFIIARKQGKYWRVTEKIFSDELHR